MELILLVVVKFKILRQQFFYFIDWMGSYATQRFSKPYEGIDAI
jgi:hypothetical protein